MTDDLEIEDAPLATNDELTQVSSLVEEVKAAQREVELRTKALHRALDRYRDLVERQLPDAMKACNCQDLTTTSGDKVTLSSRFYGSKLTDPEGIRWVEANDGKELVRSKITVELPTSEVDAARELFQTIRSHPAANRFVTCHLETSVNAGSLSAFVRELVEAGKQPPLSLLGVVRRTAAKLGGYRLKPIELKGFEVEERKR